MSSTLVNQPLSRLLSSLRISTTSSATLTHHGLTTRRSHQTTARTKRALRIRPHASHLLRHSSPQQSSSPAALDEIIFNPPSSQPTVYHTPFKFLPKTDPRRSNNLQMLFHNSGANEAATTSSSSSSSSSAGYLPPSLRPVSEKKYHLTKDDVAEIRRLRWEDPENWSLRNLAKKFDCSIKFVQIATEVPETYKEKLADDTRRMKATWGPRKLKAREERKVRKQMLFNGEL
ncbi:hypothetical protein jhhlp_007615 [Lomentospora prolificans]|uniref:Uncharacterized protein n=1 Tax=Lomentospora prolificans TaxID=41688 RepID=A0A2N3N035_9PEZI|nr:hypothetical protein jhhlp_007615 [Lomentospora prolificans]